MEKELDNLINEIQEKTDLTSSQRNILHAVRPEHPLGKGHTRNENIDNALFVLSHKIGTNFVNRLKLFKEMVH